MKIRTDYVTNSSSSSFILGFNSKEEIPAKMTAELPSYLSSDTIQNVISDVTNGIATKEVAKELYEENIWCWDWKFNGKTYLEMTRAEYQSEEYKKFIQDRTDELSAVFMEELDEYDVISIVEYGDHTDLSSALEHRIMPYLDCTIRRISHH